MLPYTWPARTFAPGHPFSPARNGQLGYYSLTAARRSPPAPGKRPTARRKSLSPRNRRSARPQCSPCAVRPVNYAASDWMGGYCYLNNAAIAAQAFSTRATAGHPRRDSLPPRQRYPVDLRARRCAAVHPGPRPSGGGICSSPGYADELLKAPVRVSTQFIRCLQVLAGTAGAPRWSRARWDIERYGADIIVVSWGVDTFKDDLISQSLDSPDYLAMGARIARLGKTDAVFRQLWLCQEEIGHQCRQRSRRFYGFAQ